MALPKFEGAAVASARLQLNGFGEEMSESLKSGEKVYFIVEAEVTDVRHPRRKGVLTRHHVGTILRTCRMDPAEAVPNLDAEEQRRHLQEVAAAERASGQTNIDDELQSRRKDLS